MTEILLAIGLVCLALGAAVILRYLRRRLGRRVAADYSDIATSVATVAADHEAMRREVDTSRRQRDEYAAKIAGILAERDEWKTLYHQQSSEHAAAQDVMMREIESLRRQYGRLTGALKNVDSLDAARALSDRDLRTDPVIAAIGEAFATEHGDAIAAARAVDAQPSTSTASTAS